MNALNRIPHRSWDLLGEFDHLVNGLFSPARENSSIGQQTDRPLERQLTPAMDIIENESNYVVTTDLPGIRKEDLKVNVKDNTLTIEAESNHEEANEEGRKVIKAERHVGKFYRTLKLGNTIDESNISADYADGVLTLTFPKSAEKTSRQIDVAVH